MIKTLLLVDGSSGWRVPQTHSVISYEAGDELDGTVAERPASKAQIVSIETMEEKMSTEDTSIGGVCA
jgi:hypothetical protein